MPNLAVDMNSWARSACYPQSTFCPLSDGASTRHRQITKTDFRPCSSCCSRSQAPFCLYTFTLISTQRKGTFAHLRYSLGGDRPSQTAHLTLSRLQIHGIAVRKLTGQGWYFTNGSTQANAHASMPPTYPTHARSSLNAKIQ